MLRSNMFSRQIRGIYLTHLIELLSNEYYVKHTLMLKDAGYSSTDLQIMKGNVERKTLSDKRTDRLENYLIERYGGVLERHVPSDELEFIKFVQSISK